MQTNEQDRKLLELAAKAAGSAVELRGESYIRILSDDGGMFLFTSWNPLTDEGDRYRLIRKLDISVDSQDCCAWKRLPFGDLIQEFWGGDCGDEPHAVLRAAAAIGKAMP